MAAKFRLGGYEDAKVDGITVEVQLKIGIFEQTLCEVLSSPLPECIIGVDGMSD